MSGAVQSLFFSSYRHKMDGVRKDLLLIILVSSIIAATPEPSSLAPGASDLLSITSVTWIKMPTND
jgi:hypothetical protein